MRAERAFTVLERAGLAGDEEVAALPAVVALRLRIAAGDGGSRCCHADSLALVAVMPTDPSLPATVAAALEGLASGGAIAATARDELVGGWIAMPGRDVAVTASADLGHDAVVAINFADAAAFVLADHDGRLVVHTTVVLAANPERFGEEPDLPSAGWHVVARRVPSVPLLATAPHAHEGSCAA
jgi:hypothetical protein